MDSYMHTASGSESITSYSTGETTVKSTTNRGECTWFDVYADGKNPPGDRHTPTALHFFKRSYGAATGSYDTGKTAFGEDYGLVDHHSGTLMDAPNSRLAYFLQTGEYSSGLSISRDMVYNECVSALYKQVIQNSSVNISVDLAESRELLRLHSGLTDAITGVISFARKARRKAVVEGGRDFGRGLASAWLSYQYGWKPLLSTIHGLATFARTKYGISVVSARRSRSEDWEAVADDGSYGNCYMSGTSSYRCDGKLYYDVGDDSALTRQRLASTDPLRLVWELFPYSFVVDWFYDIGSFLEALEVRRTSGLVFNNGYITETYLHKINGIWNDPLGPPPDPPYSTRQYLANMNVGQEVAHKGLERTVLTEFPYPRLPSLDTDLGSGQMKNGAALLARLLL